MLRGRPTERAALDGLLADLRAGRSRALSLYGEHGVGKTALLEYVAERAADCVVVRAAGVQSEMELPFAALHQLCAPMLGHLDAVPAPQREALRIIFGLSDGPAPDRFVVGLGVLSLMAAAADAQPLVCLVDDAQWLDHASAQTLAFVARRLLAESVALIFAVRDPDGDSELPGVPALRVKGLTSGEARELLAAVLRGPLDDRVRDQIIAETHGNPLALLELPRELSPAQIAGGFGLPDVVPIPARIEAGFRRRIGGMPEATQRLMLVAAAEPTDEPSLVWRAAERLGVSRDAARPAIDARLLEVDGGVHFHDPLVRSAIYRSASPEERRSAHGALAEATDPQADPDRRAWHLAHATAGTDEDVAAELERCADRAEARGGLAASAAFLERAAELTARPVARVRRALAAAEAKFRAGAPDAALRLLATAQAGPLDELGRARVDLLRAQIALIASPDQDIAARLLEAARRLERIDADLARDTYRDALMAAISAGRLAAGGDLREIGAALAARAAARPTPPDTGRDLLLDGWALLITAGHEVATPMLQDALAALRDEPPAAGQLRWLALAVPTAVELWDDDAWRDLGRRWVALARDAGALVELPTALNALAVALVLEGDARAATALIDEADAVAEATGLPQPPRAAALVAAYEGRERAVSELHESGAGDLARRRSGLGLSVADWALAVLHNADGRYEDALAAAEDAAAQAYATSSALPELVEAAVRVGMAERAASILREITARANPAGTDWALGVAASCRALLSHDAAADRLHQEAIDRLGRTRLRVVLARAHLLYGEWLRRERRRLDAREQLRTAQEMFTAMGCQAFAQRAERELSATGVAARRRTVETSDDLTAQETQIARLAAEGLSNSEIGNRLFISRRTVEYHLHKVFTKLDITSRSELQHVLPDVAGTAPAAGTRYRG